MPRINHNTPAMITGNALRQVDRQLAKSLERFGQLTVHLAERVSGDHGRSVVVDTRHTTLLCKCFRAAGLPPYCRPCVFLTTPASMHLASYANGMPPAQRLFISIKTLFFIVQSPAGKFLPVPREN